MLRRSGATSFTAPFISVFETWKQTKQHVRDHRKGLPLTFSSFHLPKRFNGSDVVERKNSLLRFIEPVLCAEGFSNKHPLVKEPTIHRPAGRWGGGKKILAAEERAPG